MNTQPEIPANHWPLAQQVIYQSLVLPAVRSSFHKVRLCIDGPPPPHGPLIVYLTHTSWWDAYMLFLISNWVLHDAYQNYILMEAKQLRAYRFFAWCGAFSIDRTRPGDSERALNYAAGCLAERTDRCLWLFPQGRIVPPTRRPLRVYPGLARVVAQLEQAILLPVALRYEYRGEQHAEAFIRCGPYHSASNQTNEQTLTDEVEQRLTAIADQLHTDLEQEQFDSYQVRLTGREGINRWFDRIRPRRSDPA